MSSAQIIKQFKAIYHRVNHTDTDLRIELKRLERIGKQQGWSLNRTINFYHRVNG